MLFRSTGGGGWGVRTQGPPRAARSCTQHRQLDLGRHRSTDRIHCDGGWSVGATCVHDVHCLNGQVHSSAASTSQTTGALVVNGGIGVGGNIFCTSTYNMSDARLKRNPQRLDDALARVCNMSGYVFEWNEKMHGLEGTSSVGVIAQEVQAQAPLCVLQNPETDLLAVEYTKLVPYMIESIKALKRKCDQLEEQLADQSVPRQAKKARK